MKVWVAMYEHKYGTDVCVFSTEEKALAWRDEIGRDWWSDVSNEEPPVTGIGEKKTCSMCPESALQPVSPYESLGMLVTHKCEICGEKWSKP